MTNSLWRIQANKNINSNHGMHETFHHISMPGIICPRCGTWSRTGLEYPCMDPLQIASLGIPLSPGPIPIDQHKALQNVVSSYTGLPMEWIAHAAFGPLFGEIDANSRHVDFVWPLPWRPMLTRSIYNKILHDGWCLRGEVAKLVQCDGGMEDLVQLQLYPTARLSRRMTPEPCRVCGRYGIVVPDELSIESYEISTPLQRVLECPTVMIATNEYAMYLQSINVRNIKLTPVHVV
jgi:hypothetical protein